MIHILWVGQNDRVKRKDHLLLGYKLGWGAGKTRGMRDIIYYNVIPLFMNMK